MAGRHYQTAPPSHLSEAGNQQQDGSRGVRLIANDMTGTGRDPVSAVRLPVELTANVDAWAESREISRSEAIRRLVELGLKAKANEARQGVEQNPNTPGKLGRDI